MTAHPIDTEALRRLADQATPGPWIVDNMGDLISVPEREKSRYGGCIFIGTATGDAAAADEDTEFISVARTAVPALLDENAALRARIKAVQDVHWPDKALNGHICAEDDHDWPCPTIRALDG